MRLPILPGALALALALLAAPADARPPVPLKHLVRVDRTCRADVLRLCGDLRRGESALKCLRANRDDLLPQCRALLEAPRLGRAALRACRTDADASCRLERGIRLSACLTARKADLEPACRDALDAAQHHEGLLAPKERPGPPPKDAPDDEDGEPGDDDGTAGDAEAGPEAPER